MADSEPLKDRVLGIVFPALAEGFLHGRRGKKRPPGKRELADVSRASTTLLYRMLLGFLWESRAASGRRSSGLKELAGEIAAVAGNDPGQTSNRIAAAYSAVESRLQHRLDRLLAKTGAWTFPHRRAAFLPPLAAADRFLATAIDGLARRLGSADRLVAVDFRAVDLRQLGVVHECLSHCKLEFFISRAGLALVGDNVGRKRAGSYYTPEPIVRRIVAAAVGPAIDRKLQAARRRWEECGRPANSQLLAELLDFRVLNPAVGSGYFLLAAADFLAQRLCDFLGSLPRAKAAFSLPLVKQQIVQRCLYGVDLDPMAVELAKASLRLDAGLPPAPRQRRPAPLDAHFRCGNSLVGRTLAALDGGGGFNVVIGNPPYRGVRTGTFDRAFADYVASHYATARGNWDLAALFLEKSLAVGKAESACGFIVPSRIAANRDFAPLRQRIFAVGGPAEVIECGAVFDDPAVLASIVTIVRPPESGRVRLGRWEAGKERTWTLPRSMLQSLPDQPLFSDLRPPAATRFRKIDQAPCRLGDLAAITRGMECGKNDPHITRRPQAGFLPVITGQSVHEFHVEPQGLFMPPGLKPVAKYKRPEWFAAVPKLLMRFVAPHPICGAGLARLHPLQYGLRPCARATVAPRLRGPGLLVEQPTRPLVVRAGVQLGRATFPAHSEIPNPADSPAQARRWQSGDGSLGAAGPGRRRRRQNRSGDNRGGLSCGLRPGELGVAGTLSIFCG